MYYILGLEVFQLIYNLNTTLIKILPRNFNLINDLLAITNEEFPETSQKKM